MLETAAHAPLLGMKRAFSTTYFGQGNASPNARCKVTYLGCVSVSACLPAQAR
jgi:hypothetical protein